MKRMNWLPMRLQKILRSMATSSNAANLAGEVAVGCISSGWRDSS